MRSKVRKTAGEGSHFWCAVKSGKSPSALGRAWLAVHAFTSRSGPGEGSLRKRREPQRGAILRPTVLCNASAIVFSLMGRSALFTLARTAVLGSQFRLPFKAVGAAVGFVVAGSLGRLAFQKYIEIGKVTMGRLFSAHLMSQLGLFFVIT